MGWLPTQVDWDSIDLVVFDLDGTLYDQTAASRQNVVADPAARDQIKEPASAKDHSYISAMPGGLFPTSQPVTSYSVNMGSPQARHGCSVKEVRELVSEWIERRPLSVIGGCRYAGIEQLFKALASSSRTVAVLSDYPAEAKLGALGLKADVVVSSTDEDVGRLKPDPTGLYKVLKLAGVEPQRSLMIGDRFDRDGEVARRVGMRALIKSNRCESEIDRFSSYTDDIFRPLLQTGSSGDKPSPTAFIDRRKAGWQNLKEKAFGYTVVGGLTAIVDLLVFRWLNDYLHPIFLAAACSFLISSVFQYWAVSAAVYRKEWRSPRRAGMFTIVSAIGLMVNATATAVLASYLPISPTLAKFGGIGIAFCLNFLLTTYVVFRK